MSVSYLPPPKSLYFNMHYFQTSLFYGYITGSILTVTSFDASDIEGLQLGSTVSGAGVTSSTYITGPMNLDGTYPISPSQNVGSSGSPITLTAIPPSLSSIFSSLKTNEYLVRGTLASTVNFTAQVYNPGSQTTEQYYDAYNVAVGDWLANTSTGYTWRISDTYSVYDAGTINNSGPIPNTSGAPFAVFYAKIVDVDYYNAGIDPTSLGNGAPGFADSMTLLFTVDQEGFPIFTPSDTFGIDPNFSGNVIGRFRALNVYNTYVNIGQTGASTAFRSGDPVYLDPVDRLFKVTYGLGDTGSLVETLGIVTSVGLPTDDSFTFNPFGEYMTASLISLYNGPTGPIGAHVYINPSGATGVTGSAYTVTAPTNYPYPVYQIIDEYGNAVLLKNGNGVSGGGGGGNGATGPTGPSGLVTSYIFDGGNSLSVYSVGPAFDCGNSV